ncbi:MAG: AbrB/MazE/SpoVT family DNA-binding domain-containing protein [Nanoarchaeota archaeon]
MHLESITRKWGNSMGITIPKDFVESEDLKEGQHVIVDIRKITDLKGLRGLVRFKKSAQQIKDEMRIGWQ